jgi:peptide/nickel transport system permease protein
LNKEVKSTSLNAKAWKRLKRNKSAMFGLAVVIFSVFLSLFAYVVSPDNSPSGNEQILQLETHPPGFKATILKVAKGYDVEQDYFHWHYNNIKDWGLDFRVSLSEGFLKDYTPIPINEYEITGDTLYYSEYRGKVFKADDKKMALNDILGPEFANKSTAEKKTLVEENYIDQRTYWLGTDKFGRDIFSRLIIGTRVSLSVGLISVFISLFIGIILGAVAGYFKGWIDEAIMWVINVFWSIPTLLLAMCLYIVAADRIENKLVLIFIAVGLTMWVDTARIVRGQVLGIRELEFVSAARSLGYSNTRIIFLHILPNILGPIIVVACANFASAILIESGLSYIGLGIQPPAPSWGSMLNEYKGFIDTNKAYLALFPGFAIMALVLAFNLVGNGLRDALDVRGQAN